MQRGRADGREHARAGRRAELDGRRADAAVRAVDDEQLSQAQAGLGQTASWAVTNASGTAAARLLVEGAGTEVT